MRLLEHQAKTLLRRFGLELTEPRVVASPRAAMEAATELGLPVVLKAQVPLGGRGKAGAVRIVSAFEAVAPAARAILGMKVRGFPVATVSVERRVEFARELYAGIAWDTGAKLPVALA